MNFTEQSDKEFKINSFRMINRVNKVAVSIKNKHEFMEKKISNNRYYQKIETKNFVSRSILTEQKNSIDEV